MNIVHVLQWLEMGGAETVALRLARAQRAAGHRVRLLSLGGPQGPLRRAFDEAGVPVDAPRTRAEGLDPALWGRLALRLGRRRPDVIHTHDPRSLVYAGPGARLAGARLIHTKHGDDAGGGRRGRLLAAAGRLPHAFVAVSAQTAAVARAAGEAPAHRVTTIPNGVALRPATGDRAAVRAELGLPPEAVVIGCVGRLEPVKGPDVLVDAVQRCPEAHLVLVGDGSLFAQLDRPRVHRLGLRHDVPRLLSAFDLFAMGSRNEGLPLALLEAMAAGLPVVATAVGGVPDAVGDAGVVVPPEDPAALAAALAPLVADAEHRAELGARARAAAARHDFAHTVAAYQALYEGP